jgi:catechol 2,3-dioxygenase-like lactoylglutathione lyase family enzyme
MSRTLVDVRTPTPKLPAGLIAGYAGVVLEVADLPRARRFYQDTLGLSEQPPFRPRLERAGVSESHHDVRLGIGPHELVLHETPHPRSPAGGAHVALRLPELERAIERLKVAGVEVHDYHEDRPFERDHNRYCADPDGNPLQLVAGDPPAIDHAAIESHDLEWAEAFYTHVLGGAVETRVGWRMDDYTTASAWGEGRENCAPGTRRWDRRYTTIEGNARVARPNAHFFVSFAPGVVLGVYLATEHRQEPPPDQFIGTPRLCFRAGDLSGVESRLRNIQLRCMYRSADTGGPFERHGSGLFVRDPGGNFLELREA